MRRKIDMDIDQLDFRAKIVRAFRIGPVNFNQLRHACRAGTLRACHDVDHLVSLDWLMPCDYGSFDVKFEWFVRMLRAKADRAIIFRDRNVCIVEIARIEYDCLRIDF